MTTGKDQRYNSEQTYINPYYVPFQNGKNQENGLSLKGTAELQYPNLPVITDVEEIAEAI